MLRNRVELLAPVSNREMLHAAIHNGADSVYIGMPDYNARGRSERLDIESLGQLINIAHSYGVRAYIACNVLIFEDELDSILEKFLEVRRLCPDAVIVQDVGLATILGAAFPDLRLHASTQTTITSEHDIRFFSDLGFKRYTLSRELSVEEISHIRKKTDAELEAFVHGSLCISYSGQCMTSSGFGGRSANRGECAQSCRHPYALIVDGEERKTSGPYLVSPMDLNGSGCIDDLIASGVEALKIEGRLKSPEYVAAACRLYAGEGDPSAARLTYSRGDSPGWLDGFDSKRLVDPRFNSHSGIEIGRITSIQGSAIEAKNESGVEIQRGDGIMIAARGLLDGSPVFEATPRGDFVRIQTGREFDTSRFRPGDSLFLTSSSRIARELRSSLSDKKNLKRIPVRMILEGGVGGFPVLTVTDDAGRSVSITGRTPIERARTNPLTEQIAKWELAALSGTIFELESLSYGMPDGLHMQGRDLKRLRQEACALLLEERIDCRGMEEKSITESGTPGRSVHIEQKTHYPNPNGRASLSVLIRDPAQVEAFAQFTAETVDRVYIDFEYGREIGAAIDSLRSRGFRVGVALNRVLKPGEESGIERLVAKQGDALLVRNAGSIEVLRGRGLDLIGDFSLNVTNRLSALYFLERGVSTVTASYDLLIDSGKSIDVSRLISLLAAAPAERIEIPITYYLPSFHMEYCLYADHLGGGGNHRSCGFPCRRHVIELRDRVGQDHPVLTDSNCRNTMFNGRRRDLSTNLMALRRAGAVRFRIEALRESASELRELMLDRAGMLADT